MTTSALSGGVMLPPGHPAIEMARAALRMKNPAHLAARRRGCRYKLPKEWVDATQRIPEGPWKGGLALPRCGAQELLGVDLGNLVERRSFPPAERLAFDMTPRPYQAHVKGLWTAAGQEGVVSVPCGGGKTVIGMDIIAELETPTLVLVHTHALLEQWCANIKKHLGIKPVVIKTGKKTRTGRICIATIQTLVRWPWLELLEWGKEFGLVVVDEAHHVPAETWGHVMMALPARCRLLLTATPERADGLTDMLHWHGGPIVAKVSQQDLLTAGVVLAPRIEALHTGIDPKVDEDADPFEEDLEDDEKKLSWTDILKSLLTNDRRNGLIISKVDELATDGRQVLVLTESKAHGDLIAEAVRQRGHVARVIHGDLGVGDREGRLEAALEGDLRVLVCTQLADEGLDLPSLDALVLTCPGKGGGRLRQRVGRVSRTCKGKADAVVVDVVDSGFLERLWWSRQKAYKDMGCMGQARRAA